MPESPMGVAVPKKPQRVRALFCAIADRYDFLNHALSVNLDRRWRRACVRELEKRTPVPNPRILDVGCGTADLSLAMSRLGPVVGCDFCLPMLHLGAAKTARERNRSIELLAGDAMALPFPDDTFDAVVSAFVLRNLEDIDRGLREMRRVLRPGGILSFLDFGMPRFPGLSILYRFYFTKLLPRIGEWISGVDGAYGYLPASVRAFPPAEELMRRTALAGFSDVRCRRMTAGIAVLVSGFRKD